VEKASLRAFSQAREAQGQGVVEGVRQDRRQQAAGPVHQEAEEKPDDQKDREPPGVQVEPGEHESARHDGLRGALELPQEAGVDEPAEQDFLADGGHHRHDQEEQEKIGRSVKRREVLKQHPPDPGEGKEPVLPENSVIQEVIQAGRSQRGPNFNPFGRQPARGN